jgi:hypothetical protein
MLFLFGGCGSKDINQEGLSIYLTRDNISPDKIESLSQVALADKPLFSGKDILSYTWDAQAIELTKESYMVVAGLQVPTWGKSFVVCVDKTPVYWGAFWAGYSSQSFNGITIIMDSFVAGENTITITQGYPSAGFFYGEDPRFSLMIKESLEKAGKLK